MTSSAVSAVSSERVERALRLHADGPGHLLTVVGPTASGKTELALLLAERLGGEIVSCDSVQIYRHFDIGSGKPPAEVLARVPHHLIGAVEPLEAMDAARYGELATLALKDVRGRGKLPILCGGTFLWVKAVLFGLAQAPAANLRLREHHRAVAERDGRPALHARLREVDPASAARLHANDFVRVSRALEVYELTGRPLSVWQAEHAFARARHPAVLMAIPREPSELDHRIEARAKDWLARGWVEETAALLERGYAEARAMASVGYREVRAHLAGQLAKDALLGAIVRSTRVFARRQRTWLNSAPVTWL